nr:ribonuclease H-like domain-containing protein [Tanacetum cinerariifolium]
ISSRLVPLTAARPVNAAVSQPHVARPRPVKNIVTKSHSPPRRTINRRPYPKPSTFPQKVTTAKALQGNLHHTLQDKGVIDSGCSKYMTENMSYLSNFESINEGYVAFGGNPKGSKITGKGKIRTGKLDFDDVYFVKELNNLFSVSQMRDKKNNVLFTDTECIVLSSDFKLPDESHGKQHRASCKTNPVSSICQSLKSKDETSPILKTFITGIENQLSLMRKIIRSDNGTEFKNHDLNQFYGMKGIKREFSVARTPQQNGIAERKNRTLIEAARTMLADSLLPIPFWAEAVNTACYVHNKANLMGRFMRDFWLDTLGGKCSTIRAFFSWSFGSNDPQNTDDDTTFEVKENEFKVEKPESEVHVSPNSSAKTKKHDDKTKREDKGKNHVELSIGVRKLIEEIKNFTDSSTNEVNATSTLVPAIGQNSTNSTNTFSAAGPSNTTISPTLGESSYMDPSQYPDDPDMPALGDITYSDDDEEDVSAEADFTNLKTTITVNESGLTQINTNDFHTCIFACFLSQEEPKRAHQALKDPSWIEAMQEELLQFKMQKVWVLVDLPKRKRAIDLCKAFEKLMKDKFLMSLIGELTFFLGLQVKQKPDGIFICQDRYVAEILRKFRVTDGKVASTPIDTEKPLLKDSDGKDVDVHTYRPSYKSFRCWKILILGCKYWTLKSLKLLLFVSLFCL